jgi:hypothetical protein
MNDDYRTNARVPDLPKKSGAWLAVQGRVLLAVKSLATTPWMPAVLFLLFTGVLTSIPGPQSGFVFRPMIFMYAVGAEVVVIGLGAWFLSLVAR